MPNNFISCPACAYYAKEEGTLCPAHEPPAPKPGPWIWTFWRFARSYVTAKRGPDGRRALSYHRGVKYVHLGGSLWFRLGARTAGKFG